MSAAGPVTLFGTGAVVALFGVLIKYFGYVNLVAGYDPEKVTDEDTLADFVGTRILAVAALTFAVAGAEYLAGDGTPWHWYAYVVLVGALAAWMVVGARRYEEAGDDAGHGSSP